MEKKVLGKVQELLDRKKRLADETIPAIEQQIKEAKREITEFDERWKRECVHVFYKHERIRKHYIAGSDNSNYVTYKCCVCGETRSKVDSYVGTIVHSTNFFGRPQKPEIPADRKVEIQEKTRERKKLEAEVKRLEAQANEKRDEIKEIEEEIRNIMELLTEYFRSLDTSPVDYLPGSDRL